MDLGIVAPAAIVTAVSLWRRAGWALRVACVILTGYTCLGVAVAAMAVLMSLEHDPDATLGVVIGSGAFAIAFAAVTVLLYRPLFKPARATPSHVT